MKTQLSILVKSGIWKMSLKAYIALYIDKEPDKRVEFIKLKPRKQPYLIDIEPGEHQFYFIDSTSKDLGLMRGIAKGAVLGGFIGIATGEGLGGYLAGTATGAITGGTNENKYVVQDNYMHLILKEGDEFKIQVTCGGDRKGKVIIKELN